MATQKQPAGGYLRTTKKPTGGFDLLWRLLSQLTGGSGAEHDKRRLLKGIAKQLKRIRFRFYRPKTQEVMPDLAKFFFEMYRVVGPARLLFDHAETSSVLRSFLIQHFMSEEQLAILSDFDEEAIRKRAGEMPAKELVEAYKKMMSVFFSGFTSERVAKINTSYAGLLVFLDLLHFDFYFLLKKFDSRLPENDFRYRPQFNAIIGRYVVDELKDFLDTLEPMLLTSDWPTVFAVLQEYKGASVISESGWKSALRSATEVHKSGVLELVVRHIDANPFYVPQVPKSEHKIVQDYLSKLKTQVEITIQKILREKKNEKIDQAAEQVFGTKAISRLRNYTEKSNMIFAKKMVGGYIHVTPLNYLTAFLFDFVKGQIKQLTDLLLVKGEWLTGVVSQQLSDTMHKLMVISDSVAQLDESVGEEGERGAALAVALLKSDQDKEVTRAVRKSVTEINNTVYAILKDADSQCVMLTKLLKTIYEDGRRKKPEIIVNWRDLVQRYGDQLLQDLAVFTRKVYTFLQLLRSFTK